MVYKFSYFLMLVLYVLMTLLTDTVMKMCFNLCVVCLRTTIHSMHVGEHGISNYRGPSQSYYCNKLIAENSHVDEHIRDLVASQSGKSTQVLNISVCRKCSTIWSL
jgi:hypothetical protein